MLDISSNQMESTKQTLRMVLEAHLGKKICAKSSWIISSKDRGESKKSLRPPPSFGMT